MQSFRWIQRWGGLVLVGAMIGLAGCGVGYHRDAVKMMHAYEAEDFPVAVAIAGRNAGTNPQPGQHRDQLIWRLEQGTLLRACGDFAASEQAYGQAELALEVYEQQAEVKVGDEAGATLTNLAALPYRGHGYDCIMLSTYRALNALKLGDREGARVEFNRTRERQRQVIERNQKRIDAAEQELHEAREKRGLELEEANTHAMEALTFELPHAELYQAQGAYVNPFAEFLQGLYLLTVGAGGGDLENGRHAWTSVRAIAGARNRFVEDDWQMAEAVAAGQPVPAVTYVIFETGRAPSRDQVVVHVPVPLQGVDYVGAAFPRLVFHGNHEEYLLVEHESGLEQTELLSDMDTIIGLEFKNELPAVVARTVLNSVIQASIHYGAHQATKDNAMANLSMRAIGAIYRAAQAQADRRTWHTLPKQFQYCRIPTPANRHLVLRTSTGSELAIALEPGEVNVVYAKSIRQGGRLSAWQFPLR